MKAAGVCGPVHTHQAQNVLGSLPGNLVTLQKSGGCGLRDEARVSRLLREGPGA